ncbi:MAG: glycosyltransferase family 4 protein [Verrucomicrobiota bacterium]
MRFLFLTLGYHPDRVGGAYRYVREVAVRLAARGHQVAAVYPGPDTKTPEKELRDGVELRRFPDAKGPFHQNWRAENADAHALCEEWRNAAGEPPVVVLCHAYFAPAVERLSVQPLFLFTGPWAQEYRFSRSAQPRTVSRKLMDGVIAMVMARTERRALRRAAGILTISRYYHDHLPQWHGHGLPAITVIGGGVDLDVFHPPPYRGTLREQHGLKKKQFVLLCVRRLDPRMGLPGLLDAFARVAPEHPNALLWIAGDGPQRAGLQARIDELRLTDRVRLLGFVPEAELPKLYGVADCTIMPSLDLEGFGLATAESLACGTPVIGSRAGATPELLAHLKPELLFNRGSVEALAEKLEAVLAHDEWLPTREHCRQYAEERFSWQRPVEAIEAAATQIHRA